VSAIEFIVQEKLKDRLGRAGLLKTPHGDIETPAFVTVGTKATVKSLRPEDVRETGAQVVLANTYHLYLQPGDQIIKDMGGLHSFMNWSGPTMTDSGGFQVLSLGVGFASGLNKFVQKDDLHKYKSQTDKSETEKKYKLAKVTEEGVVFTSHIDGSSHFFTPEKSISIQHNIGADIIFAFDECTSPTNSKEYLKESMDRTHRWATRCLSYHKENADQNIKQALFGIIQGGNVKELREESARFIGSMDFDGFGIGGSYTKEEMKDVLVWVNSLLPSEKPRHLLGIGEPIDLFDGIESGVDLFDCVSPTRIARNGSLYTRDGRINITNARYVKEAGPVEEGCLCYTCRNYSRSYLAHLFRGREMLASTLASIHNLYFIVNLVDSIRRSLINGDFFEFKDSFLRKYYG
jgi:queuine tRNA-ribosyltransferase